MKGSFSLYLDHETNLIFLNKLRPSLCNMEPEIMAVGSDGVVYGTTVAHDIIEHSKEPSRTGIVTLENELRALGAAFYCRSDSLNVEDDIANLFQYVHRSIQPVPQIIREYIDRNDFLILDPEIMKDYAEEDDINISIEDAIESVYQATWGYLQKYWAYPDQNELSHAFHFVSEFCDKIHKYFYDLDNKLVVHFDSSTEQFWCKSYQSQYI